MVMQAFSVRALKEYESSMLECGVSEVLKFMQLNQRSGTAVNLGDMFHRATMNVIGKVAFGSDLNLFKAEPEEYVLQVNDALQSVQSAVLLALIPGLKYLTFIPFVKRTLARQSCLERVAAKLYHKRRAAMKSKDFEQVDDLLHQLITAKDPETGDKLSDDAIIAEVVLFLIGGSETSSNTMTWTLYLLLKHPHIMATLLQEIDRVSPTKGELITHTTIKEQMPYLQAVLEESMRIIPASPGGTTRQNDKPIQLGSYYIPSGTIINCHFYSMHHNPAVFPDPHVFDPTRFLGRNMAEFKNKHEVFSAGTRSCVGKEFARMEMKLVLGNLLKTFRLELVEADKDVNCIAGLTMTPDSLIMVYVKERVASATE
jgi:cytochrome P450